MKRPAKAGVQSGGLTETGRAIMLDLPPFPGADAHEAARLIDFGAGKFVMEITFRVLLARNLGYLAEEVKRVHGHFNSGAMFIGGCHRYIREWHDYCRCEGVAVPDLPEHLGTFAAVPYQPVEPFWRQA